MASVSTAASSSSGTKSSTNIQNPLISWAEASVAIIKKLQQMQFQKLLDLRRKTKLRSSSTKLFNYLNYDESDQPDSDHLSWLLKYNFDLETQLVSPTEETSSDSDDENLTKKTKSAPKSLNTANSKPNSNDDLNFVKNLIANKINKSRPILLPVIYRKKCDSLWHGPLLKKYPRLDERILQKIVKLTSDNVNESSTNDSTPTFLGPPTTRYAKSLGHSYCPRGTQNF